VTRKLIIDTDTASDDAVAILMALRSPAVEVVGITVVAGNMPVERGARNALYTAEMCGVDVPVYRGAEKPLLRENNFAFWFHGDDGMGNQHYPPPKRQPETQHAVDALIAMVKAHPGVELVTLGPLTNIALALAQWPQMAEHISRCVVMGGAPATVGNVTPAAEYNIWVDPEAARKVFHSGLPIEMVGWQLGLGDSLLTPDDIAHVYNIGTPLAKFAMDCNVHVLESTKTQSGEQGMGLHDPTAMAILIDPTICTAASTHYVDIETHSELTRGMTVVDQLNIAGDDRNRAVWHHAIERGAKVKICWAMDGGRWKQLLYSLLE